MKSEIEILEDLEAKIWATAQTFDCVSAATICRKGATLTFYLSKRRRTLRFNQETLLWEYGRYHTSTPINAVRRVVTDIASNLPQVKLQKMLGSLPRWAQ